MTDLGRIFRLLQIHPLEITPEEAALRDSLIEVRLRSDADKLRRLLEGNYDTP